MIFNCESLADTEAAGGRIANQLSFPGCVLLHGELGAGKTTLCRAIVQALGYQGAVTSPTYNLIHEYPVDGGTVYHLDLYRVNDPGELEFLGLQDLYGDHSLFLVEWPERGNGWLPPATHNITLEKQENNGPGGRRISIRKR